MTTATSSVRFLKFCVTDGTTKARVHYGLDNRADGRKCVTIYSQDYGTALGHLIPDGYENHTDLQTDYFDKGHVDLTENHPLYAAARARAEQCIAEWQAHRAKMEAKRAARRA